jgi:hypothetical protein
MSYSPVFDPVGHVVPPSLYEASLRRPSPGYSRGVEPVAPVAQSRSHGRNDSSGGYWNNQNGTGPHDGNAYHGKDRRGPDQLVQSLTGGVVSPTSALDRKGRLIDVKG